MTLAWICACVGAVLGQSAVNLGLLIMSPILISEICPHHTRAAISQVFLGFSWNLKSFSVYPSSPNSLRRGWGCHIPNGSIFSRFYLFLPSSNWMFYLSRCSILYGKWRRWSKNQRELQMGDQSPRRDSLLGVSRIDAARRRSTISRPPSYGSLDSSESQSLIA